ncbi:hypothetical protein DSECCO2_606030 [anaerobic digester metagenome]
MIGRTGRQSVPSRSEHGGEGVKRNICSAGVIHVILRIGNRIDIVDCNSCCGIRNQCNIFFARDARSGNEECKNIVIAGTLWWCVFRIFFRSKNIIELNEIGLNVEIKFQCDGIIGSRSRQCSHLGCSRSAKLIGGVSHRIWAGGC